MTELAGGELCLSQRPHNQVGAARRRRRRRRIVMDLILQGKKEKQVLCQEKINKNGMCSCILLIPEMYSLPSL